MRIGSVSALALAAAAALGTALGMGGFAFAYAKGMSYAGNDPATCANCHVMTGHYDGWQKSSHHAAATCNDCHTPGHGAAKYAAKAANGWHHSKTFTVGAVPDVIQVRDETRAVIDGQCRSCHEELVLLMTSGGETSCIRCHPSVGHFR